MTEQIKQIEGFPDYLVSNYGYVLSLKWGKRKKLSVSRITSEGYPEVVLRKDNKSYSKTIHTLVMRTFGEILNLPIDHIDENKMNPRFDNLRYLTDRDNLLRYHKKVKPDGEFKYNHINWLKREKRWRISIMENGKRKIIGYHKDQEEAKKIQDAYLATNSKD